MIYSTPEFLILLGISLPAFILVRAYWFRFALLLCGSLFFYSWAGFFDTVIFLFVVALSWAAPALALKFPGAKRPLVAFGIFVLAAHLLFWKYMPWIVRVAQGVDPAVHGGEPLFLPLPVGISFFTLQGIAYLVDFYKGEADFIPIWDYVLFKSFFPQLVAGPIVRVPQLLPQLRSLKTPSIEDLYEGARLFCWGFFKKIALADRVAPLVDEVFMRAPSYDRKSLLLAVVGYTVQIWADFSGYSDMGIGVARMFGIRLPINFLQPYFSRRPSEFWRRWHITLSQWIRDYIYIPFGGSRGSPLRVVGVAVLTMAISGLWHGAAWTFVAWGFYHGFLLVFERLAMGREKAGTHPLQSVLQWCFMTAAVMFGWLLFRAQGFDTVGKYVHGLVFNSGTDSYVATMRGPILFAAVMCWGDQLLNYVNLSTGERVVQTALARKFDAVLKPLSHPSLAFATDCAIGIGMAALVLGSLFLRGDAPTQAFIYFQF